MLAIADVAAVTTEFHAALAPLPPATAAAGRRLLARIATPNWLLEWSLPRWLGRALHLPPAACDDLAISNVYGLAYWRLADDLSDGEAGELAPEEAAALLPALYDLWVSVYRRLFAPSSPFWAYFDAYLAQWQRSYQAPEAAFRAFSPDDFLRLAQRGALLKNGCAGACLLAAREERLPALAAAVDHWLTAAVLLDSARDWESDLAAGRYNPFVAYMTDGPQTPALAETNHEAVLEGIYLGDGGRGYFRCIRRHLAAARRGAAAYPELTAYLAAFERTTLAGHENTLLHARNHLHTLTAQLFGLPAPTAGLATG